MKQVHRSKTTRRFTHERHFGHGSQIRTSVRDVFGHDADKKPTSERIQTQLRVCLKRGLFSRCQMFWSIEAFLDVLHELHLWMQSPCRNTLYTVMWVFNADSAPEGSEVNLLTCGSFRQVFCCLIFIKRSFSVWTLNIWSAVELNQSSVTLFVFRTFFSPLIRFFFSPSHKNCLIL